MKNRKIATVLKQLCCIILSLIVISPFYMIVINSFKTKNEAARMSLAFPATWVFTNFGEVIKKGKLVQGFINSLTYAGVATFIGVIGAAMAAYTDGENWLDQLRAYLDDNIAYIRQFLREQWFTENRPQI